MIVSNRFPRVPLSASIGIRCYSLSTDHAQELAEGTKLRSAVDNEADAMILGEALGTSLPMKRSPCTLCSGCPVLVGGVVGRPPRSSSRKARVEWMLVVPTALCVGLESDQNALLAHAFRMCRKRDDLPRAVEAYLYAYLGTAGVRAVFRTSLTDKIIEHMEELAETYLSIRNEEAD